MFYFNSKWVCADCKDTYSGDFMYFMSRVVMDQDSDLVITDHICKKCAYSDSLNNMHEIKNPLDISE